MNVQPAPRDKEKTAAQIKGKEINRATGSHTATYDDAGKCIWKTANKRKAEQAASQLE